MTRPWIHPASLAVLFLATATILMVLLASPAQGSEPPFELVFPQNPEKTIHHDDYGAARSGGRSHRGNDLMAPKLTLVYAVADGFVESIAESSRAGRYLIIRHGGGWRSWYVHLNNDNVNTDDGQAPWSLTVSVEEGDQVSAGDLIGFVGDSGNAEWTGSHTHFELDLNGQSVDPYPYLAAALERALLEPFLERFSDLEGIPNVG
jgi:murein DD-endopeptidase MepM/ murein hydrolase activator NlpD